MIRPNNIICLLNIFCFLTFSLFQCLYIFLKLMKRPQWEINEKNKKYIMKYDHLLDHIHPCLIQYTIEYREYTLWMDSHLVSCHTTMLLQHWIAIILHLAPGVLNCNDDPPPPPCCPDPAYLPRTGTQSMLKGSLPCPRSMDHHHHGVTWSVYVLKCYGIWCMY